MLAELNAMKLALSGALSVVDAATVVGVGDMSGHMPPFVSVWAPAGGRGADEATGPEDAYSARVGVTFTAARTDAALAMAAAGVAALTPARRPALLTVAGRTVWVEFAESRTVQTDRDVTLPGTNTHPAYAVVLFDVHSTPAPVPPEE